MRKILFSCLQIFLFSRTARQNVTMERAERQLPAFARASQNMAAMTLLLDALPAPSTDGVCEMYQRLKSILGTVTARQVESSLQYQVGQRVARGAFDTGTTFSPAGFLALTV
jgi:hypothetical protein